MVKDPSLVCQLEIGNMSSKTKIPNSKFEVHTRSTSRNSSAGAYAYLATSLWISHV